MIALPAVAACNSIVGFGELRKVPGGEEDDDPDTSTPGKPGAGTRSDGGSKSDAPPASTSCDLSKPFSPPVALPGPVNSASFELAPSLTANELTIIFQRTVGPEGGSIMLATRASTDAPFGEPRELTALAAGLVGVQQPTMTADGLLMFFVGVTSSDADLFTASRASPSAEFTNRRAAIEVSSNASESFPSLTPDGAELWFSSEPGVGQPRHFVRSVRDNLGSYGVASGVSELTSTKSEAGIAFSADGLTIYFGSERDGGKGDVDIYTARRQTLNAAFGPATPVAELNTGSAEYPGWLSADGCRLYFASDRSNNSDLFVASRAP